MAIPVLPWIASAGKWLLGKIKGRPTVQTGDRSVVAGGDQTISGPVSTGDQATTVGQADVVAGAGSVTHIHHEEIGEKRGAQLDRMESMLAEVQKTVAPPPAGSPPVDTEALAAQATPDTEGLLAEAIQFQRQHKEREGIECLLEAYRRDLPSLAKAQLHLLAGNGFLNLSELGEAEDHYEQSLMAARQAGDKEAQAAALGHLGLVYSVRGDLNKAEQHYMQALAVDEEIGNKLGQADALGNLGNVYADRADLEKAEEHHRRALAIHEEIGNQLAQAKDLGNLGNVYADRGDLEKAEEHYKRALAIHEQIGNKLGQARQLGNLGGLEEQRGNLAAARELVSRAAALFEEIGAGGEGPETVAAALKRLDAAGNP